jgi:hypothetical protein
VNTLRGAEPAPATPASPLSIGRFALVVYTLGPIGWLIEALVTASILGYAMRVRPQLVLGGALVTPLRGPVGDEGWH